MFGGALVFGGLRILRGEARGISLHRVMSLPNGIREAPCLRSQSVRFLSVNGFASDCELRQAHPGGRKDFELQLFLLQTGPGKEAACAILIELGSDIVGSACRCAVWSGGRPR